VWVTVETTVVYENGSISGFRHKWTFDEFYTAMAIQGLDVNNDGVYSREELAELAKVNIDGLKEFEYFTHVRLAGQPLALEAPKDYWLEHGAAPRPAGAPASPPKPDDAPDAAKPGLMARLGESLFGSSRPKDADAPSPVLSLHFTVPLKQPVLAEAADFAFSVYDPSFFIAFELAKTEPVKIGAGAPPACRVEVSAEEAGDDERRLGDALTKQLGPKAGVPGYSATRPIKITCGPRS
jgi:ABC-type uncharacterized transport system substrate-binding protein